MNCYICNSKKILIMNKSIFILFLLLIGNIQAQTKKQRKEITKYYNITTLKNLSEKFSKQFKKEKKEALIIAKQKGWKIKGVDKNGSAYELIRIDTDGNPVYYQTTNYFAAKTIRTDKVYNNGGLGLNLQGQNMIVGLWDGGPVRLTHQKLNGKVVQRDNIAFNGANDLNRHATHVSGTMIAKASPGGLSARGMAFDAHEWAHDWNNDAGEMANEAAAGLLVSNHSYGMRSFDYYGNRLIDIYWFGKYNSEARNWDEIMFNAPYYLAIDAAGNDRYYASNGSNKGGYDMLTGNSTTKNGITVAAIRRVNNYSGPSSVHMSGFSNWGPTDDGRIKPDISGQGVSVYSCVSDSDTSYATYDGTSMASPTITGSSILLQQHYHDVYGNYMRASTLKGLILHTADEAGSNPGPDYKFGWGLMNTGKAAVAISDNGIKSIIKEVNLSQGDTYSFTVHADGTKPLMASICWTDPAGNVITGTPANLLDNPTPALVNDLDIRVTKNGTTYYPWKLNPASPANAATKGDNLVDNFEKVQVDNPSGDYTITISHKGNLLYGNQKVSIIVTGIAHPFAINSTNGDDKAVCSDLNTSTTYQLHYKPAANTSGNTGFSLTGLPTGASVNINPNSLSAEGDFTVTISNLNNVVAGKYTMEVIGQNNGNTQDKQIKLHVLKNNFNNQVLINPADASIDLETPFNLEWEENPNAQKYRLQIAYNSNFSNLLFDDDVLNTSYLITENTYGISSGGHYYWRVKPVNECASGNFSSPRSFTMLNIDCGQAFNQTPVTIPSQANSNPITSILNYPNAVNIDEMHVYVNISHSKISDLKVSLISPSNTSVVLTNSGTCQGNFSNIDVTYRDDATSNIGCNSTPPAIGGETTPFEALANFNGENAGGNWTLKVEDPINYNGGSINIWALEICTKNYAGVENNSFDLFKVWPNPTHNQVNLDLRTNEDIEIKLIDNMGRAVYNKSFKRNNDLFSRKILFGNLKKGVYLLYVRSKNKQALKKLIIE